MKPPPNKINVYRSNIKRKNTKRRKVDSESESDEDSFSGLTMSNMGKYFEKTYDTITDYVPGFSFFGSTDGDEDDENDDDEDDASEKRKPKLKYSLYSKHPNKVPHIQEKTNNRWFDKFFYGSDDGEEITASASETIPKVKVTTESGFFSWLGGSAEVTTEISAIQAQTQTEQGEINE